MIVRGFSLKMLSLMVLCTGPFIFLGCSGKYGKDEKAPNPPEVQPQTSPGLSDQRRMEIASLIAKEPTFNNPWMLPEELSLPRIKKLVEKFSSATYGKAFRFIGNMNDFDHGHVLFTEDKLSPDGRMQPFAILYHTQEMAGSAHWKKDLDGEYIDAKYDYLDVRTRNWIQWLSDDPASDGDRIENARDYVDPSRRDPAVFFGEGKPMEGESFTIKSKDLDLKKLGNRVILEVQVVFTKGKDCVQSEEQCLSNKQIKFNTPEAGSTWMKLSTAPITFLEMNWAKP